MSARKLQAEIDRTFKRVAEGVAVFESTYEKLNTSSNKAQNEKIEQDLKKEIKKLQRYRDQIKTWAASNDIKDKRPLLEHRRLIEVQMEKFKACEKEIKTKQFSKEGLSAVAKLDPKEREKIEMGQWISQSVDELERQVEQAEAEIEALNVQVKKGKKDSAKNERLEEVEHMIERHKWHTDKLEQVLRLLENGGLETDQVGAIKEDVQYYIDSNQDADFAEDDNIYDELNLGDEPRSEDEDEDDSEDEAPPSPVISAPKSPELAKAKILTPKVKPEPLKAVPPKSTPAPTKASPKIATEPPPPPVPQVDTSEVNREEAKKPSIPVLKYASAAATGANIRDKTPRIDKLPAPTVAPGHQTPPTTPSLTNATLPTTGKSPKPMPAVIDALRGNTATPPRKASSPSNNSVSQPAQVQTEGQNYHIPACLLDLIPEERTLTAEEREELLEASFKLCPTESDGERPYHYIPKEPFPTPPYYPSMPLDIFNDAEAMEKIEIDTLFYIFYYQKGTYQQFLASRELKKQAWRFHKRYLTWFQRHEEPKVITDEYESGTYRYFDFEASWVQRKKNDFKFQYAYLEEERGDERV
ncbi:Putative uncharacterized protein [Taphrina deformans PYCC 5710]|uniref:General negative regulator of transcription subunit n=1 Tax=Taphrina deformans (strain PYCC 5710 / ATCC 11124 / CBS 356.35 / IMI 108563 / JCM 9778 / NBRC 8474) TaxID=1097556 RepID=R4XB50_TAPDE|nr:Putative uncharacterized protein [Taphrina deformans PYCC 5710]|eukprot:CCG83053.1 Putative uncharacterized protein [Taphrina deformans PYCC 5710]